MPSNVPRRKTPSCAAASTKAPPASPPCARSYRSSSRSTLKPPPPASPSRTTAPSPPPSDAPEPDFLQEDGRKEGLPRQADNVGEFAVYGDCPDRGRASGFARALSKALTREDTKHGINHCCQAG